MPQIMDATRDGVNSTRAWAHYQRAFELALTDQRYRASPLTSDVPARAVQALENWDGWWESLKQNWRISTIPILTPKRISASEWKDYLAGHFSQKRRS